jgi:hypothetical protein
MTIHTTANYNVAYADADTPLADYPLVTQQAAQTIDTALGRGGIAPPDATTQAQLAGRIAKLEQAKRVLWVVGTAGAQGWVDTPVTAWGVPRYGAPTLAGGVFTVPAGMGGEWRLRARLYPAGGTDQAPFVARFQRATAAAPTTWTALAAHVGRLWPNESSIALDFDGALAAGDRVRIILFSSAATLPTLGTASAVPFWSADYLGATPTS